VTNVIVSCRVLLPCFLLLCFVGCIRANKGNLGEMMNTIEPLINEGRTEVSTLGNGTVVMDTADVSSLLASLRELSRPSQNDQAPVSDIEPSGVKGTAVSMPQLAPSLSVTTCKRTVKTGTPMLQLRFYEASSTVTATVVIQQFVGRSPCVVIQGKSAAAFGMAAGQWGKREKSTINEQSGR